jgi:hypothetical protein
MSRLALDDGDRHSFPGELDSAGMTELIWGKAAAHACLGAELSKFRRARQ